MKKKKGVFGAFLLGKRLQELKLGANHLHPEQIRNIVDKNWVLLVDDRFEDRRILHTMPYDYLAKLSFPSGKGAHYEH